MECFGTTDFDNNSRLITLSAIIISGLHCIAMAELLLDVLSVTNHPLVILSSRRESDHTFHYLRSTFYLIISQETTSCNSITWEEEQGNQQNGACGSEVKLGMHTEFRCGSLAERDNLEYLRKCGRILT
jgi:hypothetical protein